MNAIILVTVVALFQFFIFGALVAIARAKQGIAAPAMTGTPAFERLVRVHLNTLERLVLFVPLMWLAAQFWNPLWVAGVGVVFLVARMLYWRGYVKHPDQRMLGNVLSMIPIGIFLLATLVGLVRSVIV